MGHLLTDIMGLERLLFDALPTRLRGPALTRNGRFLCQDMCYHACFNYCYRKGVVNASFDLLYVVVVDS